MSREDKPQMSLDNVMRNKRAIQESNALPEHYERLRMQAKLTGQEIIVRDLSQYAGKQLAENIQYDPSTAEEDTHKLSAFGKDLHVKAKSSTLPELGGLIPAQNILSKRPAVSKDEREKIDEYFKKGVDAPDSEHKFVTPKKTVDGKEYDICFYSDPNKQNGVGFAYKDGNGKYFSEAGKAESLIKPETIPDVQDVKVFADKKSGQMLIPDYDLASLGSKKSSVEKEYHPDRGFFRPEEKQVIEGLEKTTHNMVRHGADTENPVGYKFEMSKETPYTAFTADGRVHSIDNEKSYVDFINQRRESGYNHVLNPRTGVEMGEDGKYSLPPVEARMDYEKIDKQITALRKDGKIEQADHARKISNKEIEHKQMQAALPEAVHAMEVEKAHQSGKTPPTFEAFNEKFSKRKDELKASLHADMQSYKDKFGEHSPTKAEADRSRESMRQSDTGITAIRSGSMKSIVQKLETTKHATKENSEKNPSTPRTVSDSNLQRKGSVKEMRAFFEKKTAAIVSNPISHSSVPKALSKDLPKQPGMRNKPAAQVH